MRGMKKHSVEKMKSKEQKREEIISRMYLQVGEEGKGERMKTPSRNEAK